jgi:hypothetical protein
MAVWHQCIVVNPLPQDSGGKSEDRLNVGMRPPEGLSGGVRKLAFHRDRLPVFLKKNPLSQE